jgi:hypothetical protein
MFMKTLLPMAAASAFVLAAGAANATVATYTSASAFQNAFTPSGTGALATSVSDPVDWGVFDASLSQPSNNGSIANNSTLTTSGTNGNEQITVQSGDTNPFTTYVQGQTPWKGMFATGTTVLFTSDGAITLSFATAVTGVGLDLQIKNSGAYGETITAYNATGGVIGTATDSGTSTGTSIAHPGTVIFAGITSDAADISYVIINSSGANTGNGFAIDTSLIYHVPISQTGGGGTQTPEPGTLGLLGAGLAGLGLVRRNRRKLQI